MYSKLYLYIITNLVGHNLDYRIRPYNPSNDPLSGFFIIYKLVFVFNIY